MGCPLGFVERILTRGNNVLPPDSPVAVVVPKILALVVTLGVISACAGPSRGTATPAAGPSPASAVRIEKDFTLVAYQGEPVLSGEGPFSRVFEQGKPVILNFWAGQCPPCRAEMPEFQRVADEFQGKVIFVGVDVGPFTGLGTHDDARRLLQELGIRYPAGYAVDASPLQLYNVRSMPTTVFLTATGEVSSTTGGILVGSQLRGAVQRLVGS